MKHLKRFNESSMSPIPTAEEYAKYMLPNGIDWYSEFGEMMIEFAKLHVEMALKAASEDANMDDDYYQSLQVYPLENIK
jgi:hypothetical protein